METLIPVDDKKMIRITIPNANEVQVTFSNGRMILETFNSLMVEEINYGEGTFEF